GRRGFHGAAARAYPYRGARRRGSCPRALVPARSARHGSPDECAPCVVFGLLRTGRGWVGLSRALRARARRRDPCRRDGSGAALSRSSDQHHPLAARMIPLKDDIPSTSLPFVTIGIIVANVLVFLYQLSLGASGEPGAAQAAEQFVFEFGAIPCRL